jgi:hypothetical protein
MKVAATNGYKKATRTFEPNPVGAAAGCDLLTLTFQNPKQDQTIAACGSSYKSGSTVRQKKQKKRPEPVGAFSRGCGLELQRVSEHHPDAVRPG